MILLAIVIGFFINRINFYGEIIIQLKLNNEDSNFRLFAYSPKGRKVEFYKINNNAYFIKGYYNSLNIKSTNKEFPDNIDSVSIKINGETIRFGNKDFFAYWNNQNAESNNSYYSLKTEIVPSHWINKFFALLIYTFPNYFLCFVFLVLLFVAYFFAGNNFRIFFHKLAPIVEKKILLFCFALFLLYLAVFSCITRLDDKIKISGDYPVYQIEAVNLIEGPISDSQSFFEKYKFDNIITDSIIYYEANYSCVNSGLSAWVPPAYPIFLGVIYKIFGVSPYIARFIQLILFLIVAAFIPLLMFYYFKIQGFVLGIFAGLIFIINIYPSANEIMTEPLMVFFCFLLLFAMKYFEIKMSNFSAILLGVTLTISLFVKGVVIFFIFFFFILMIYRYFKLKRKLYSRKILIVIAAYFVTFLPWIIYSNLNEGIIQKSDLSKKEISEDVLRLKNILVFVEKQNNINQLDSILKANNKNEFHANKITKFINRSCIIIEDYRLSELQRRDYFIITLKQIIKRIDELLKVPYIKLSEKNYIYFNKPVLISTNHTYEIYESNNKKCIDGDIHCDKSIKETYDENLNSPSYIRVLNFYYQNPCYIFIIFPNKLFNAFNNFPFFLILMSLIISNFIFLLPLKRTFVNYRFTKYLLFILVPFFMLIAGYNVIGFNICLVLTIIAICESIVHKRPLFLFQLPLSSNLLILNFIIITLIFFGNRRIISIIDFVFITSSILYFFHYYGLLTGRNVFKKDH